MALRSGFAGVSALAAVEASGSSEGGFASSYFVSYSERISRAFSNFSVRRASTLPRARSLASSSRTSSNVRGVISAVGSPAKRSTGNSFDGKSRGFDSSALRSS